jgi:hypothetical protein
MQDFEASDGVATTNIDTTITATPAPKRRHCGAITVAEAITKHWAEARTLAMMSVDELWSLHEELRKVLSTKFGC